MEPEPSSAIDRARGQVRRDKTGKTVSDEDIPLENRAVAGVDEGITEGAIPPGERAPKIRHEHDRPSRGINRGLHS